MGREFVPIMLSLKDKKVIVIGGGRVATRKIGSFLNIGADITVISPSISEEIREWWGRQLITWIDRKFEQDDLQSSFLIIAATSDSCVTEEICRSIKPCQLINVADNPGIGNFILPASLVRGKLVIAVSSSGASPSLSQKIVRELSSSYDESYEEYLDFLDQCRRKVLAEVFDPAVKNKIFKDLLQPEFLEWTRKKRYHHREEKFQLLLKNVIY